MMRHHLASAAALLCAATIGCRPQAVPQLPAAPDPFDLGDIGAGELPPLDLLLDAIPVHHAEPPTPLSGFPAGVYENDFEMAIHFHPRVLDFIDLFTGRFRDRFAIWLGRRGRFEPMITDALRDKGLPAELLHLPLVESGFSVTALSRARALGLWQFMAGTARIEGLEVSAWLDERRDPERATLAAVQHLERLQRRYGSWYLALAAYNSGPGRVDRALAARGLPIRSPDSAFWTIRSGLPAETRDYVPSFLAAAVISRYPALFGFSDVLPAEPDQYDVVTVPDETELAVIAKAAGVAPEEVAYLNQQYVQGVTPPGRSAAVRIPAGTAEAFEVAYAAIPPAERVTIRWHVVRSGETLSSIAARYGSTVDAIRMANGITQPNRLSVGRRLRIPRPVRRVAVAPAAPSGTR
jgi:membrane-bound lytic murein transglycosylase D